MSGGFANIHPGSQLTINNVVMGAPLKSFSPQVQSVKTRIGLVADTPEALSSLGRGTWPQLMCCALVAVRVPEVGRGQVGVSEQGGSSDDDQDSERRGGNKLEASETRGICPKQAGGCRTR